MTRHNFELRSWQWLHQSTYKNVQYNSYSMQSWFLQQFIETVHQYVKQRLLTIVHAKTSFKVKLHACFLHAYPLRARNSHCAYKTLPFCILPCKLGPLSHAKQVTDELMHNINSHNTFHFHSTSMNTTNDPQKSNPVSFTQFTQGQDSAKMYWKQELSK